MVLGVALARCGDDGVDTGDAAAAGGGAGVKNW